MKIDLKAKSFLAIGKTQESTEGGEGFKKYVGYADSKILAYNPTKERLDEILGYESSFKTAYTDEDNGVKQATVLFVVQTNPDKCNGVDMKNLAIFTLKAQPAITSNGNVQVIDDYGNYATMNHDDAKAHKALPGNYKIDQTNYHIACDGEVDLVVFLKKFLNVPNSLDYANGTWTVKKDAAENAVFKLEHIKDYFKGDFSEIKEALDYQPNNEIKLLYGVKTKDGKNKQVVCTSADLTLRSNANSAAIARAEKDLAGAKRGGKYSNIDYRIQELQEYNVEPTNLDKPAVSSTSPAPMPWDD